MRSITFAPLSVSRFFCWIGVSAASTMSSCASCVPRELRDLLDLALAEQGRGPHRSHPKCAGRDDAMPMAAASPCASSIRASADRRVLRAEARGRR